LDWDVLEEDEAFTVQDLLPDSAEERRELWEWKEGFRDTSQGRAGGDEMICGSA